MVSLVAVPSRRHALVALIALTLLLPSVAAAGNQSGLYVENGLALGGYDPVAYFTMESAVKGTDQHTVEWGGAVWHFANREHADLFAADPEKYQPRYGGFCALGVAKGTRMRPDMTAWEIHDGQLYLYFSPQVAETWQQDREGHQANADAFWLEPTGGD